MSYFLLPTIHNIIKAENIQILYEENDAPPIISKTLCNYLNNIKKQIDKCSLPWDCYKKYTNPYEYIHSVVPNSKQSICKSKPLSRSFYKMIELCNLLYILDDFESPIETFHLAEGPGGFIEAITYLRNNNNEDSYYGMTLLHDDPSVPGWKKSKDFLSKNSNVKIETGVTGTGDLFCVENLKYCCEKYKGKMSLITGDGGFDFSIDFNRQESLSIKLIIAQIFFAVSMQKYKGNFILKVFDNFTQTSMDILYLLALLYEKVYIVKPNTSRYANSERYIVCKEFKLLDTTDLVNRFIFIYPNFDNDNNIISRLLNISIPYMFVTKIEEYNSILGQQQLENISSTLHLIENVRQEKLDYMKKHNIQKCITWCQKNHLPFHKVVQQSNIFLTSKTMSEP